MGYRLIDKTKARPCTTSTIFVNGSTNTDSDYNANTSLMFKASVGPKDDIAWDFGDETGRQDGFITTHAFRKTGKFIVTATVNGICITRATISVVKPGFMLRDSSGNIVENISGDDQAIVGMSANFRTALPANTYKWTIENNSNYKPVIGKQAAFKFKTRGVYSVLLVLDNNPQKSYRKQVVVTDPITSTGDDGEKISPLLPGDYYKEQPKDTVQVAPAQVQTTTQQEVQKQTVNPPVEQPTEDEPPSVIVITDVQLKGMLEKVVRNEAQADDFKRYLCGGPNTKVRVNNEKNVITLTALCDRLRGKKIDIESAQRVPDPDNNDCEISLIVKYSEHKGLWPFKKN